MTNCFNNVYKDKVVLVTGHTGFKGSWITMWLKLLGAKVIGYSQEPNTNPSLFNICEVEKDIISIIGDIRDEQHIYDVIEKYRPEMVFHMAAQPLVRDSYENPKETYEINVMGTISLFEAIRKSDFVKTIVNITTDKCYENKEWIYGYREVDPMGGYDPYSSSKACVELLTSSYRRSFFEEKKVKIATVRAGNVIGGGDWAKDRLIPDIVRSITFDNDVYIRNPKSIRPWQHVLEPLSGYLWLGALMLEGKSVYSEGWNFGPEYNDTLTVKEILDKTIEIWGKGNYVLDLNQNVHEANLLKLDISKAKSILSWRPLYNSNKAIEETVVWYKNYYQNPNINIKEFTLKQINEYVKYARKNNVIWSDSNEC